jgi:hypothetical protein
MSSKQIWKIVGSVLIFLALIYVFCSGIIAIPFYGDEATWISTSSSFEAFFTGDSTSPLWNESYWTLTQPPLPRYFIGFGRWIGGFNTSDLNDVWDWNKSIDGNRGEGRLPTNALLWWSRLSMGILAVISILAGFILLKGAKGFLPGCLWLGLCLISNYFLVTLRRAMGESPLLACITLFMLLSNELLKVAEKKELKKPAVLFLYFLIMGIIIGLAESSKLNGLSLLAAGIIFSIIIAFRVYQNRIKRIQFGFISILILITSSQFTWISLNPYLWPDPMNRTIKMFNQRVDEIHIQENTYPASMVGGITQRIEIVTKRIFYNYAAIPFLFFWPINIIFFMIGLVFSLVNSFQFLKNKNSRTSLITICIVGIITSFPSLLTPLDWDRYYLLPVFFSTIFIAIGIGVSILFVNVSVRKLIKHQQVS